jgi:predicted secreted protein
MTLFQMFMAYSVAWWLVLFMVLPFGAKAADAPEAGHAASAPAQFNIRKKIIITSVLAIIPVCAFKYLYESGVVGL